MAPLFSQKHTQDDMPAFFLLEKNEIMLLTSENNGRGMILFHLRGKFSYTNFGYFENFFCKFSNNY